MDINIDNLLENLKEKLAENLTIFEKILSIKNKRLQKKEIEIFSNISSDINNMEERIKEFYYRLLDKSEEEKTSDELIAIRDLQINNKIQDILLPYMIYMKIVLENNNN